MDKIVSEIVTAKLRFKEGKLQQAWGVSTAKKAWTEWRDVAVVAKGAPDRDE